MHTQTYALGPTAIGVTAVTAQQQKHLDDLWRQLFQVRPLANRAAPPLQLTLTAPHPAPPLPGAKEVFRYGPIQLCQSGVDVDLHFGMYCGASWLHLAVAQGRATGHIAADFSHFGLVEQREFFQVLFFLLLRRQGYYTVHANAVLPPPQSRTPQAGVLIVGDCGAGKTTLTLSLLQAGWRSVGDDLLILAREAGAVVAYGMRRGFSCTPQTMQAFPALQSVLAAGPDLVRNKKFIQAEVCYPAQFTTHCTPQLLLFPSIVPRPASALVGLAAAAGMSQLLGQPRAGILFDPPTVASHFQCYAQLARQAASAQLLGGQDVLTAPAAVGALFEAYLVDREPVNQYDSPLTHWPTDSLSY